MRPSERGQTCSLSSRVLHHFKYIFEKIFVAGFDNAIILSKVPSFVSARGSVVAASIQYLEGGGCPHLNYIIFFRPLFAQFEVAGALHSIYLSSYFEDHQWPSSASSAARPIKGKGEEEIVHVLSVRSLQFINLKNDEIT